jgi:hypothetical protein
MARISAVLSGRAATPTLEVFRGLKHSVTSVGISASAVPATNLSNRKALLVQNMHATASVYLGGNVPEVLGVKPKADFPEGATLKSGVWFPSAGGTNEWFFATSARGTAGLTQPACLYYATVGGAETLATAGTVGSIAAQHGWAWGDGDTLGFNTVYIRSNGTAAANSPLSLYESIVTYFGMPDTSSTYGVFLGPYDAVSLTLCGSARLFAISDTASTPVVTLELL